MGEYTEYSYRKIQVTRYYTLTSPTVGAKNVKLSISNDHQERFLNWFEKQRLIDTHIKKRAQEKSELLNNERLGDSREQRSKQLTRINQLTKRIGYASIALSLLIILLPVWHTPFIVLAILTPFALIAFPIRYSGVIAFYAPYRSIKPTMALPYIVLMITLGIRSSIDYHILEWQDVWVPFTLCSLLIMMCIIYSFKEIHKNFIQLVSIILVSCFYGYGTIISLNGILDTSKSTIQYVSVMDKSKSGGYSVNSRVSYHLDLAPWGERTEVEDFSVSKWVYDKAYKGGSVIIYINDGGLGIKHFHIVNR